ncbi:MAG: hypothetical protein MR269_05500 [Clostridiales bacterium]|uniref:hypothetical protein n=1 Tax=Peptostreptococcus porci TaxID=2652282 RepID=UPI0029DB2E75|nr:hypothetical protein [Peptostreptococcus porci]MCI5698465.1 hypothetical protein [Clostridiales bacterium]MDY4129530.1 hypothetical protein [Peptostreptococcus porci]
MKKMEAIIKMLKSSINDKERPEHEISSKIEDFINDNFWDIDKENHELASFLNDDVLDICEQTEPGLEGTNFRKEIKEAYSKILEMLN